MFNVWTPFVIIHKWLKILYCFRWFIYLHQIWINSDLIAYREWLLFNPINQFIAQPPGRLFYGEIDSLYEHKLESILLWNNDMQKLSYYLFESYVIVAPNNILYSDRYVLSYRFTICVDRTFFQMIYLGHNIHYFITMKAFLLDIHIRWFRWKLSLAVGYSPIMRRHVSFNA